MYKLPLTVKRSIELMGLAVLAIIIAEWRQIIMPLLMAAIASLVLLPVYKFLKRYKMGEFISIFLSVLLMISVICLIIFFISLQVKPVINNSAEIRKISLII